MGTKATVESMVKLCDDFLNISRRQIELIRTNPIAPHWYYTNDESIAQLLEIGDKLTKMAYDEARAEEVIKKIIERSKQDLINLIKEDEAFTNDEEIANQILQKLRNSIEKYRSSKGSPPTIGLTSIEQLQGIVMELERLLKKDADIAEAVQIVSRDLEKLMQTLRKAEK